MQIDDKWCPRPISTICLRKMQHAEIACQFLVIYNIQTSIVVNSWRTLGVYFYREPQILKTIIGTSISKSLGYNSNKCHLIRQTVRFIR